MPIRDEFVTGAEFGRWRQDFNEFQRRLEQRLNSDHAAIREELGEIKDMQREANGKTAANIQEIAIIRREIEAIKSEDNRIESVVKDIKKNGCHQYADHTQTLEVLEGAGVLPNTDGSPAKVKFALGSMTPRQKTVAGVGVAALLIPAVAEVAHMVRTVFEWMSTHGQGVLR